MMELVGCNCVDADADAGLCCYFFFMGRNKAWHGMMEKVLGWLWRQQITLCMCINRVSG
jgi:hypothetical protein